MRISIDLPPEFEQRCDEESIAPREVIARFVRDLCALDLCGGTNEREAVQDWFFSRCGRKDWNGT